MTGTYDSSDSIVYEPFNIYDYFLDVDYIRKSKWYVYAWYLINYLEPKGRIRNLLNASLSRKAYIKIDCDEMGYQEIRYELYTSHFGKGKMTYALVNEWLVFSKTELKHGMEGWYYPEKYGSVSGLHFMGSSPNLTKIIKTACKLAK